MLPSFYTEKRAPPPALTDTRYVGGWVDPKASPNLLAPEYYI